MKVVNHRLCHDDGTPYPFVENNKNMGGTITPDILLMHYTAGTNAKAAVNVLTDPRPDNPSRAVSAHIVLGRDGSITQLVPFNRMAWHAGYSYWEQRASLNRFSIGIEMDNEGYVKKMNGVWMFRGKPTTFTDEDVMQAMHWKHFREYGWVRYPQAQWEAAVEIALALRDAYPLKEVLGHEDVHIAKVDPGPAFDLKVLRMIMFEREEPVIDRYQVRVEASVYKNRDDSPPHLLPRTWVGQLPKGTKVKIKRHMTAVKRTEVELPPKKGEKKKKNKIKMVTKVKWSLVTVESNEVGAKNVTGWILNDALKRNALIRSEVIYKQIGTNPGMGHPLHSGSPLPEDLPVRLLSVQGKWALVATLERTPRFKFLQGWVYMEDLMRSQSEPEPA